MKIKRLIVLRSCMLLLVAGGLMVNSHEVKADPVTLNIVVLNGDPEIPCNGSSTFRLRLRGGTGPPNTTFNLTYTVFGMTQGNEVQLDPFFTIDVTIDSEGKWSKDIVFSLHCVGCSVVQGFNDNAVNSGSPIFARVSVPGSPFRDSNAINVSCATTPEPTTIFLLGTGLAGVAIRTRKKLKNRN